MHGQSPEILTKLHVVPSAFHCGLHGFACLHLKNTYYEESSCLSLMHPLLVVQVNVNDDDDDDDDDENKSGVLKKKPMGLKPKLMA